MALQYAGIDLTYLTPIMSEKLEQFWQREAPKLWSTPGFLVQNLGSLPIPPIPKIGPPDFNVLRWPNTASRWGEFITFVGGPNAQAIEAAVGLNSPTSQPLIISYEDDNGDTISTVSADMYLIGLRPLFIQTVGQQFWLMHLVDERYYWWMANFNYSFTPGTDSWQTLLTNLVANVTDTVPTFPAIPGAYGMPSSRWNLPGRPVPPIIDAAAATVGLRLLFGLDGTVKFTNATTAQTDSANQYDDIVEDLALGGMTTIQELIGTIPESVSVFFEGSPPTDTKVKLSDLMLAPFGTVTGVSGTTGFVWADASAGSIPSGYATQAATDYYNWLLSLVDATFRSVQELVPTGMEDRIEWEYMPGRQNFKLAESLVTNENLRKMPWERVLTRIVRRDWGDNNLYGDASASFCGPIPINANPNNWTPAGSGNLVNGAIYDTKSQGILPIFDFTPGGNCENLPTGTYFVQDYITMMVNDISGIGNTGGGISVWLWAYNAVYPPTNDPFDPRQGTGTATFRNSDLSALNGNLYSKVTTFVFTARAGQTQIYLGCGGDSETAMEYSNVLIIPGNEGGVNDDLPTLNLVIPYCG